MRRNLASLAVLLCCTSQPRQSGHGGAAGATSSMAGTGGADAGTGGAGGSTTASSGTGGGSPIDGGQDADADAPDCGSPPNGGIGSCVNPIADCPSLTLEQSACWRWECFCPPAGPICVCSAMPAQ